MWYVATFFVVGLIFYWLANRQKRARRGAPQGGGGIGFSLPQINFAVDRKAITAILVIVVGLLAIYFFPDTVPGKALMNLVGMTSESEWFPWVFQYIPFALIVMVAYQVWFGKTKGKLLSTLVTVVAIIAICVTTVHAINIFGKGKRESTGKTLDMPDVTEGQVTYMVMRPADSIKTFAPMHRKADGQTAYRICLEITAPKIVTERAEAQNFHFLLADPNGTRQSNIASIDPGVKKLLDQNNFTEVKVAITQRTMRLGTNPCPRTAWSGAYTAQAIAERGETPAAQRP